jgi:dethiobiotin synthetase
VEGAGGVYSPIAEDGLNADLAQVLGLPVVLITEDKLGCMNHVLMAVEVLQRRQLTVAGVLLNRIHTQPNSMDNLMDLSKRLTVPVFQWVAH